MTKKELRPIMIHYKQLKDQIALTKQAIDSVNQNPKTNRSKVENSRMALVASHKNALRAFKKFQEKHGGEVALNQLVSQADDVVTDKDDILYRF